MGSYSSLAGSQEKDACHGDSSGGTSEELTKMIVGEMKRQHIWKKWGGGNSSIIWMPSGGAGLPEWASNNWIPLMRPHYGQDPAVLLPPAVSMARARESCPARAACSGHLAQARAAKAQSLPWVEVNIWASWVTGPSWSQCPSQGLGPQSGLAGSQQKSAECVWGSGCMRLAWKQLSR